MTLKRSLVRIQYGPPLKLPHNIDFLYKVTYNFQGFFVKERMVTLPKIHIVGFASKEHAESNPNFTGFCEKTGLLFYGRPSRFGGKYVFSHEGEKYMIFRAKGSRANGVYRGVPNGQISLVRLDVEGFNLYQILSGARPIFIEKGRQVLPSGRIQQFGIYYALAKDVLIHY